MASQASNGLAGQEVRDQERIGAGASCQHSHSDFWATSRSVGKTLALDLLDCFVSLLPPTLTAYPDCFHESACILWGRELKIGLGNQHQGGGVSNSEKMYSNIFFYTLLAAVMPHVVPEFHQHQHHTVAIIVITITIKRHFRA